MTQPGGSSGLMTSCLSPVVDYHGLVPCVAGSCQDHHPLVTDNGRPVNSLLLCVAADFARVGLVPIDPSCLPERSRAFVTKTEQATANSCSPSPAAQHALAAGARVDNLSPAAETRAPLATAACPADPWLDAWTFSSRAQLKRGTLGGPLPPSDTMGLSLEFYAGDAKTIARAFNQLDLDGLRDGTAAQRYADFSLHLSPTDLDLLSEVLAEHCGVPTHTLYDCVGPSIAGQPGESDAYLVDPKWVKMVAVADLNAAESLAEAWIARVGKELGEPVQLTRDAVAAVQNLIALCRDADARGVDVVHTWYL